MKKFELLNLENCNTNEEITNVIKNRVKEVTLSELIEELSKKFTQFEKAAKIVYTSLATGGNCILHGPGGYAKSALIKSICNLLGIPLICKVGYKNMTPEELFGTPNMKLMLEESKYETAFENSVFSKKGVLVIEEALDMAPQTAASLKDILTERGFREGSLKKESLVSSVILTGNKNPEEESIDESIRALYLERFPYRCNIVWENHLEENYLALFKKLIDPDVYDNQFQKLSLVARLCENSDKLISPRTAELSMNTALNLGVEFLDTVSEINTELIESMQKEIAKESILKDESNILDRAEIALNKIEGDINKVFDFKGVLRIKNILNMLSENLTTVSFSDESYNKLLLLSNNIDNKLLKLDNYLSNKSSNTEDSNFVKNIFYGN